MSRRRGQPQDERSFQEQHTDSQRTRPAQADATYLPSSDGQYTQPFEIHAAEQYYSIEETPSPTYFSPLGSPRAARTYKTERQDVHQPPAPSGNSTGCSRTNKSRVGREIPSFANRAHAGDNRKPPPSPVLSGRIHKTEIVTRRSPRNADKPRPNYAQKQQVSPPGRPPTSRSTGRSETKKLAEQTVRGMQTPDKVQLNEINRSKFVSMEVIKQRMDKASMTRMAAAARLFHENPHAKPYFHNVWHEERNTVGQTERQVEKVLFFGHLDNIEGVSAVMSPDRRYFLLRQEEIDQKADVNPISWAGFSVDPRLRSDDGWGAVNYQAIMELMSRDREGGGRVTKYGRTLRLLERRDELDALTPDEREAVFNTLRRDMPVTPATPAAESRGHDGRSGFFRRSSKRDEKQKQLVEQWERGMLSNQRVKELQDQGVLPHIQRSRPERKAKGPVAALYEHNWEADLYPNEKKLSRRKR